MTALVIRARSSMTNPLPDTPILPDIVSNEYFDFDARSLVLGDGDTVESWVGRGVAAPNNRVLNTAQSSSTWALPQYSRSDGPGQSPAVVFNGVNQRIRTTDKNVTPYVGPFTVAVVGKGAAAEGVTLSRIYGSSEGASTQISASSLGNIVFQQGGSNILSTPIPPGHFAVVFSVSETQLIMMTSAMDVPESVSGDYTPGYRGFGLGGSYSFDLLGPFQGAISRVTAYTRALNRHDVIALMRSYRNEYGI